MCQAVHLRITRTSLSKDTDGPLQLRNTYLGHSWLYLGAHYMSLAVDIMLKLKYYVYLRACVYSLPFLLVKARSPCACVCTSCGETTPTPGILLPKIRPKIFPHNHQIYQPTLFPLTTLSVCQRFVILFLSCFPPRI